MEASSVIISVIIPVRNEERSLSYILDDLISQNIEPHLFEIIVVDGESDDNTANIAHNYADRHPNIRLLKNPNLLSSYSRNIGAKNAKGKFLLFIDGHCRIPSRDMLCVVLDCVNKSIACISRPQPLVNKHNSLIPLAISLARKNPFGHCYGSMIYCSKSGLVDPCSAGCGYDAHLFWKIDGFDEQFDACEDFEFNYRLSRLGLKALHLPQFTVSYFPRETWRGLFKQLYRYGRGRARMLQKHPASFSIYSIAPALGFLIMLAIFIASFKYSAALYAFIFLLVFYGICLLSFSNTSKPEKYRLLLQLYIVFALIIIHTSSALGFISGFVKGPDLTAKKKKS